MKKLKVTMTALVLTLVMAFAPATAFAAEVQEDPFVMLREMLGIQRDIVLTPEAMELALYDFDYLVEKIIAVAPTQNILERRFGEDVPSFFNIYRELLVHNIPLPSLLSVFVPERWADTPTDPLYIATDYLFTLLMLATGDLGGLGHMSVQEEALIAQTFFAVAQVVHRGTHIDYDDVNARVAAGESLEDIMAVAEALVLANDTFARFRYDIYNTPSVLWFYGFEPSEFD
ncbi:MAG: hypothetical protein FWG38_05795, partial [Defluviitaleaceae bacterium]|nr:hypothetical protein [Defluviitaleaceae bacterium]